MRIRIDFKSGGWISITNVSGIVTKDDTVSVNLKITSRYEESYDVPEYEESPNELRRDYSDVNQVVIAEE